MQPLVASPDGAVSVRFGLDGQGRPRYAVQLAGRPLLGPSPLGLETSVASWERDLRVVGRDPVEPVQERYTLLHGKCSVCTSSANRRVVRLADADGHALDVVFRVSNDGVALRYRIPAMSDADSVTAERELTGFRFPEGTRTWLMPMDAPSSGWMHVNPAYESHYVMNGHVGVTAPTGVGWAFPGLFRVGDVGWALVTEAGMDGTYCASRLRAQADSGLYTIGFPEPGEGTGPADPVDPSFTRPFASPWRLIIVGRSLAPIVDTHLVTDVSAPSRVPNPEFVKPGKVAWSWLPLKDASIVPDVQRRFIDMAAEQGYPYVLVDNWWDQKIGYDGLAKLVKYAADKGVGILVWYNSNGHFNDAPQTPKNRMIDPDVRRAEFHRLREMGVRGVKVDFMGGDKQSVIRLYLAILRDAADARLMVNFHGATLPRGWSRTWPNYMTAEAVRGYEYITFGQEDADLAPSHAAVLPFTRNAVGPMDFTPTMFSDRVGASVRRTSDAFDLAMNIVFESGLQHLGVTERSLKLVPEDVRSFLSAIPVAWDETRFLDGFPGRYVVIARRKGERWWIGGINGSDEPRTVELDLGFLKGDCAGTLFTDGADNRSFARRVVPTGSDSLRLTIPAQGGFAGVVARH